MGGVFSGDGFSRGNFTKLRKGQIFAEHSCRTQCKRNGTPNLKKGGPPTPGDTQPRQSNPTSPN